MASFALCAAGATVAACGQKTDVVTRTVTTHVPTQCAPDPTASSTYGFFVATGDFDPAFGVGHALADVGAELSGVPAATRNVVVDVSAGDLEWRGLRDVPASGDLDVLVWPFTSPCALTGAIDSGDGIALGAIDEGRAIVVGGTVSGSSRVPRAWVADLTTGALTPMNDGLLTARAFATVTPFGNGGALVAGGANASDASPLANAEVFVPTLGAVGDFDHAPIALSGPRVGHGAVALSNGQTLIVGGRGAAGTVLRSIEIVDPASRTSRTQGLAQLEIARANPSVLRLANGEILIAGGVDDQMMPVTKLEWLTPDATQSARVSRDLVARKVQGFVALAGGGALAVIAPDPTDTAFSSVWVISASGDREAATPVGGTLTSVALFEGSGGRPVLWTGDRWLRWSPWDGSFASLDVAAPAVAGLPLGPSGVAFASPEPGLALFLTLGDTRVTGLRFASQSEFGTLVAPLIAADTALVAPDRLVLPGTTTSMSFDASVGLSLTAGATAFVTDLTFADFALDADAPTSEPPVIVLRDELGVETEVGGAACAPGAVTSLHLDRTGARVRLDGVDCGVTLRASARISVGFRAATNGDRSVVRNLRIARR